MQVRDSSTHTSTRRTVRSGSLLNSSTEWWDACCIISLGWMNKYKLSQLCNQRPTEIRLRRRKKASVVFRWSFGFGRRQVTNFRPAFGFGRKSFAYFRPPFGFGRNLKSLSVGFCLKVEMGSAAPCSAKRGNTITCANKKWVASSDTQTFLFKHTVHIQSFSLGTCAHQCNVSIQSHTYTILWPISIIGAPPSVSVLCTHYGNWWKWFRVSLLYASLQFLMRNALTDDENA